jgi:pilus assembly protein Flp/PilA
LLPRVTRENPRIHRSEFAVRLITKLTSDFWCDESGATSIEYALIATGLSIVILAAVTGIGRAVKNDFVAANDALK